MDCSLKGDYSKDNFKISICFVFSRFMDCSLKGDYSYDDFKIGIYSLFSPVLWIFLSVNFILIKKNTFPPLELLFTPLISPHFSH
jgi:hypothetical protein